MSKYLPARLLAIARHTLRIDSHNDTLRTETRRCCAHKLRISYRRGIDANLVGSSIKHRANVLERANSATHCQRNEHLTGDRLDSMDSRLAAFMTCSDVEKSNLIGACITVAFSDFDRIPGVSDIKKLDAFNDAAVFTI